jgi:hypothetical protein
MRASELKPRHPLAVVRVGPTRQSERGSAVHAALALRSRKNLHTAVGGLIQLGSTLRHGVAIIGVGEAKDACESVVFSPVVEMR